MARIALAVVFFCAAVLKIEYFYIAQGARVAGSVLSRDGAILTVVSLEAAVAIGLFTRFRALAAAVAILIAVAGVFVVAHVAQLPISDCRCLGRVSLSPAMHVTLSACVLFLGGRVMLEPDGAGHPVGSGTPALPRPNARTGRGSNAGRVR